jgi:hypothetical protein
MAGYNLLTPGHRSIRKYYENPSALRDQGVLNGMSVRSPFESLLQEAARLKNWAFIAVLSGKSGGCLIRPDGTLRDHNSVAVHTYQWHSELVAQRWAPFALLCGF